MLIILITLGIIAYQTYICNLGMSCITSPGFEVKVLCDDAKEVLNCNAMNMKSKGEPEYNNDVEKWCVKCEGEEPVSCSNNKYPLCFFKFK